MRVDSTGAHKTVTSTLNISNPKFLTKSKANNGGQNSTTNGSRTPSAQGLLFNHSQHMPLSTKNATGISSIKGVNLNNQNSFNGNSSLLLGTQKSEVNQSTYQSKERQGPRQNQAFIPADYSKNTASTKTNNHQTPMHSFTGQTNRVAQKVKNA